jgi:DNA-binding SARP family transcriptional activator
VDVRSFGVLGPVVSWDATGQEIDLRGPRHRAVLARLLIAHGRTVPVRTLVDDLWIAPPDGAVAAIRTFVAALRRALEPGRPPRARPTLLVTEGSGYALKTTAVDAQHFEAALRTGKDLDEALRRWRGPAYADFPDEPWTRAERARLTELRLQAVEREASRQVTENRPADAIPPLDAHVTEHPWREEGWRLLALALYRTGRQGDALAVLRRARAQLGKTLGLDPGPRLDRLERDILRREPHLDGPAELWSEAAATYDRLVTVGRKARLETTVGLLRSLAVTGGGDGLGAAQRQRLATIRAAEELGDPLLTARVIGAYDVPAVWPRSDDPATARHVVTAARHASTRDIGPAAQARLLATIAVESRGTGKDRDRAAAEESVRIARELEDPNILAFALNGLYMQTFYRCGLARQRDAIGQELIDLSTRHGLPHAEVLGHLIRIQTLSALGDPEAAALHAKAADDLAADHELPLVAVFTVWFNASRHNTAAAYRAAGSILDHAGMPGLTEGLLSLALREPKGLYRPWITGIHVPDPPRDPMAEILWCLAARAAIRRHDISLARRARAALQEAAGEHAANGLLTLGPIRDVLADLDRHIDV